MSTPAGNNAIVVVAVGTDHHQFDRLVRWADEWFARRQRGSLRCVIQYGTSVPPHYAEGSAYLKRDEFHDLVEHALAVVCHGGPSTIVETIRRGRVPFVVPRSPDLGEHVDGHQERFTALMAQRGLIRHVGDQHELVHLLDAELETGPAQVTTHLPDPEDAARLLGKQVGSLLERGPSRRLRALRSRERARR